MKAFENLNQVSLAILTSITLESFIANSAYSDPNKVQNDFVVDLKLNYALDPFVKLLKEH